MATAQDVLKTLVKLEGGSTYISGMSAVAQADKSAAEQHLKLMDGYRKAQGVMAGLAAGAALGIGYVAKQADAFDQYRNKLEIATKSAEKAGKIFSWAQNYANATPFETGQVVEIGRAHV